jgi:protein TonB
MRANRNQEDAMNRAYTLPATFALTMHAFVLFGLSGKPPPVAPPPEDPPPKAELSPRLLYEELVPPPPDEVGGERRTSERHGARRLGDLPPLGPTKGFVIPPLPPIVDTGTSTKIPVDWELPGVDFGRPAANVIDLSQLDRVPRARLQPAPEYPYELLRRGVEVTVVVEFLVDESGCVYNAAILRATAPGFEEAVLRAVEKWRFEPGCKNGRRVRFRMSVPVVFSVRPE